MFTPLTVCFVVSVWVGGSLCQPEPDTVYNTIAFYGATKFLEYTARLPELDTRLKDASGESHLVYLVLRQQTHSCLVLSDSSCTLFTETQKVSVNICSVHRKSDSLRSH